MRHLYNFFFRLLQPFIILRLLWRSYRAPAYRRRWNERFARFEAPKKTGGLWVHAVSLGEAIAAAPLIKAYLLNHPNELVTVTTMTPTGSEKILTTFGDKVFHVYVPYDLPRIVKRFLNKIKPQIAVIMETELWPNLLHYTKQQHIPLLLANGRLSERSTSKYALIKPMVKEMLQCFSLLAVQTKADAERFIKLGMEPAKITITGSIKFDTQIPGDLEDKSQGLKRLLGVDRLIWIAASTHEGEEEQVLDAFAKIRKTIPTLLLILVPRHPERFNKVAALCKKRGYQIILRTHHQPCKESTDIFLGDTMGELMLFYNCADIAFVGGSLMPIGGHNLLEPAALAKPSITGPHMHNFTEITHLLLTAAATKQIQNSDELAKAVIDFANNKELRKMTGLYGQKVVRENTGALAKHLQLIEELQVKNVANKVSSLLPNSDDDIVSV